MSTVRNLTAILAPDVVGYSRLLSVDEVASQRALKAHRREVVDPAIAVLKSGRTSIANGRTKSSATHRSTQPSSSGRKGPKFLKSLQENLGNSGPERGPIIRQTARQARFLLRTLARVSSKCLSD